MMEFYQAYANYQDLMNFTEELFHYLCDQLIHSRQINYQGHLLDFDKPFARLS